MKLRRMLLTATTVVALAMVASGCFGKFAATRALYNFNQDISSNKFVQTLVMWGLIIIPAYELFSFGDFLIFNTIEFWTGNNVLSSAEPAEDPDGAVRLVRGDDVYELRRVADDSVAVSRNGQALGTASQLPDGSLAIYDQAGELSTLIPASDVQSAAAAPALQAVATGSVR